MKILIAYLVICMIFCSCKKATEKTCYTCKLKLFTGYNNAGSTTTETESVVCDKTQLEIEAYMKAGTVFTNYGDYRTQTTTTCTRQQ